MEESHLAKQALQRKQQLLKDGLTAPIPHSIGRELLPLMVSENKRDRDAVVLYVYLLSKVNGDKENNRYMSAWPSNKTIAEETGIDKNNIKRLSDLLEKHGLIKTEIIYSLNKKEKLYYPMYSPVIGKTNKVAEDMEVSEEVNEGTDETDAIIDWF